MTLYEYRCGAHGPMEARFPMGTAPSHLPCSVCGGDARRAFTAPRIAAHSGAVKLREACEATAERPSVVSSIPGGRSVNPAPSPALDPRMQRLPRP